jgi:hypothetical protein
MKQSSILFFILLIALAGCSRESGKTRNEPRVKVKASERSLLFTPDTVNALMVIDFTSLPDPKKAADAPVHRAALDKGIAVLYTSCSEYFPDLFLDDDGPECLDALIESIRADKGWIELPVFVGGLSAQGTRALRYAAYCASGRSISGKPVDGVFVVDSPLDLDRFYRAEDAHGSRFINGMEQEADLVMRVLAEQLGGTPDDVPEAYQFASVFTHDHEEGGNAHHLLQTPIIFFTEPDMNWWINERNATYVDINAYDLVACTQFLRANGNDDVNLHITSGRGFDSDGNRKPHSWSIVDESVLTDWMLRRI